MQEEQLNSCTDEAIESEASEINALAMDNDDAPQKNNKQALIKKVAIICLSVLICSASALALTIWYYLYTPIESHSRDIEIIISSGTNFSKLSNHLEKSGLIRSAYIFNLFARWSDADGKIRIGRFLLNTEWTPVRILEHLIYGPYKMDCFTIPEGLPVWEVGKRLEEAGFVLEDDFTSLIRDKDFLSSHGIPFKSAEGFLFPNTYKMMRPLVLNKSTARKVIGFMIDTFWKQTAPIWAESMKMKDGYPQDIQALYKTLTLASIVEKETSVPEERARVAGVYANRLRRNMPLGADPAVIYGLGEGFQKPLLYRHLEQAGNPYNTYRLKGLPPSPICSPGLESIKAALTPERHRYIFFVATGVDKKHIFSETLAQHNKAVAAYRNISKNKMNNQ